MESSFLNWEAFGVYPFSMGYADLSFFNIIDYAFASFRLLAFKGIDSSRNAVNVRGNRLRLLFKRSRTCGAKSSLGVCN
jgi:hypothetical protein